MSRSITIALLVLGAAAVAVLLWGQSSENQIQRMLGQDDPLKALQAYDTIAEMKPVPLKELVAVLQRGDSSERYGVLAVLRRLGTKAESAIPEIISALNDSSPDVRRGAATCLGAFGSAARTALPQVEVAARSSDPGVAFEASEAYWKITGDSAAVARMITNVMPSLDSTDLLHAVGFLGTLGNQAQEATPTLKALLKDSRKAIRFKACEALANIDPSSEDWVPVVVEMIELDEYYRTLGLELIARHSKTSIKAAIALETFEKGSDSELRRLATAAKKEREEAPRQEKP